MLKASSLIYAITIILLTGIMASSFLLYNQLSQKETDLYLVQYRLNKNVHSGIEYILAMSDYMEYDTPEEIEITDTETDKIRIEKKTWGMFDIALSTCSFKNKSVSKSCFIGSQFLGEEKNGLFVADLDRAISICGKTVLEGITYLPEQGVKRAYIEGQNYMGDKLVYGQQRKSTREIPDLNRKLIERNLDRLKGKEQMHDSVISVSDITGDTLIHPFSKKTLVIKSAGKIDITHGYFEGNIIFYSPSEIKISGTCNLKDVILYASKIEIESLDTSSLQAFASDTLVVAEKSILIYPTILGVINDKQKRKNEPVLEIKNDVLLAGSVFAYDMHPDYKNPVRIILHEKSTLFGEIYSNGQAQLQGEIYGSAIIQKLYLKTNSSGYENHLLNVVIDGNKIPPLFCGIELKDKRYKKIILSWL